jgi:hypothetical protein
MNECDFHYVAGPPSTVSIKCPAGKEIQMTVFETTINKITDLKCTVSIPTQGPLSGISYHDASTLTPKTELTVETFVKGIKGTAGIGCKPYLGFEGIFTEAEFTTGTATLTGETEAGVYGGIWYE